MKNTQNYLDNSILLDIYNYPKDSYELKKTICNFTNDLITKCDFKKNGKDHDLYKETIKQFMLNAVVQMITERPIAISLNRNHYTTSKRLNKIGYRYPYLKAVYTYMRTFDWIEVVKGHRNHGRNDGKTTRFWCSQKLIDLLSPAIEAPPVKIHDDNYLILKKRVKNTKANHIVDFNDTDHPDIPQIRKDLHIINTVACEHSVTLDLSGTVVSSTFLDIIKLNRIIGELDIIEYECHYKITRILTDNVYKNIKDNVNFKFSYHNYRLANKTNKNIKLNTLSIIPLLQDKNLHLSNDDYKKYFNFDVLQDIVSQCFDLISTKGGQDYYYLHRLKIDFKYNALIRIFNDNFDHCGRFFNLYQRIPSELRKHLLIDGERTVEVDIKACTLQMLYHLEGLECPDSPYSLLSAVKPTKESALDACDKTMKAMPSKDDMHTLMTSTSCLFPVVLSFTFDGLSELKMKKFHKFAQIVMVNVLDKWQDETKHEDESGKEPVNNRRTVTGEESATRAICDELQQDDYGNYTWNDVTGLIEKFKSVHHPIRHHLFKGVGLQLQNIESKIANRVLLHFAEKNILCLCIHDSFRIAEQHKEELITVLEEAYQAELNFKPALTVE